MKEKKIGDTCHQLSLITDHKSHEFFLRIHDKSRTISRVLYLMIIYLDLTLPPGSSDLPEDTTGRRIIFYLVLLRMGFTYALSVTRKAVGSYPTIPPLPIYHISAVYFCCTGLRVTSTGRYPASCPMKPGLSSPETFQYS